MDNGYKWSVGELNDTHIQSHVKKQIDEPIVASPPLVLCLKQVVNLSNPKMIQLFMNMSYKALMLFEASYHPHPFICSHL
jgi:hypothetical protein